MKLASGRAMINSKIQTTDGVLFIFRAFERLLTIVSLRGGRFSPPPPVFCIFLEKPPLQPIMKPICKFLLDPRDEPQTLIIPKKYDLVAL